MKMKIKKIQKIIVQIISPKLMIIVKAIVIKKKTIAQLMIVIKSRIIIA